MNRKVKKIDRFVIHIKICYLLNQQISIFLPSTLLTESYVDDRQQMKGISCFVIAGIVVMILSWLPCGTKRPIFLILETICVAIESVRTWEMYSAFFSTISSCNYQGRNASTRDGNLIP